MIGNRKVAVIGGGSWATAIVKLLIGTKSPADQLNWYMRSADSVEYIKQHDHNPNYLSSVDIGVTKNKIYLTSDINDVINRSDILIFCIPSAFIKEALKDLKTPLQKKLIVSAVKGIIPEDNLIITDYFNKKHKVPHSMLAVVSGPSHAEEIALERLTYLTIACRNRTHAKLIASLFECRYVYTRTSKDVYGIEYGAVLKNIYAIATGVCHGIGYGDNFQAVLVSNAMQEMRRFITQVHPLKRREKMRTMFLIQKLFKRVNPVHRVLNSSVYLGDLLVTCYSQFSRNRTFGNMIGKGHSVRSAQLEMNMIAEGYYATKCVHEINKKFHVKMPICEAMYRILYQNETAKIAIHKLTEELY